MGLSLGGQSQQSSSNGSQSNTYSGDQSGLQSTLLKAFQTLLPGVTSGGIGPNVQALQTQGADTINKSFDGVTDRVNKFLAARGFGSSGESGKATLSTELGRQSALATNNNNAAGLQLGQNDNLLSQALAAAYQQMGFTGSQASKGSGSNWGASASATFGF